MKPETRTGPIPLYCSRCGDRYWSWGAHAERCRGVVPETLPCDCPPGLHQRDCPHVTGTVPCPRCGEPTTPDWVGDPKVGWCSPCNLWTFEYDAP